jgi:glycosyltransferase involved in cell wall biosynthesis
MVMKKEEIKMKILFLCTFYHRAMLFRQQMDALISRGNDIAAFNSTNYGDNVPERFIPIMDDLVTHVECWNKYDRMLFFPRQWKVEERLEKAYDLKSFDLLHSHLLLSSGYSALRMKKKHNLPYVVSVRNTDINGFMKVPGFKYLAYKILKEASGVLFLSNTYKRFLYDKFLNQNMRRIVDSKCVVIGNCVEKFWEEHTTTARKYDIDRRNVKILLIAKIKPIKNITVAARSIEVLRKRGYGAELTVVGENQDEDEYQRIKKYDCVKMLPFKTKEELIEIYRENDIFLLPSLEETFGRVYAEAMTQGLPILYTKGEGYDGNYDDGEVGYAIPADSPETIADRIELVIKNYRSISARCYMHCNEFYERTIMDRQEEFYHNAIGK